jgi:hypothetical protein
LLLANAILEATSDASAMVRFEAVIVLARLVEKYLPAFLAVSEEMAFVHEHKSDSDQLQYRKQQRFRNFVVSISSPS